MRKIVLGFVLALAFFSLQHSVFALEGIIQAPGKQSATCGSVILEATREIPLAGDAGDKCLTPKKNANGKIVDYVRGNLDACVEGGKKKAVHTGTLNLLLKQKDKIDIGSKIKGGCVQLSDIPIIVIHLIDLATKLAGTIAVIFLLYAGFQMIISGVSDDREAAKNTIKYAITGLIVSFLAWVIVNLVQVQLTI